MHPTFLVCTDVIIANCLLIFLRLQLCKFYCSNNQLGSNHVYERWKFFGRVILTVHPKEVRFLTQWSMLKIFWTYCIEGGGVCTYCNTDIGFSWKKKATNIPRVDMANAFLPRRADFESVAFSLTVGNCLLSKMNIELSNL